jgi:membrane-associated phospholipid phosphatase
MRQAIKEGLGSVPAGRVGFPAILLLAYFAYMTLAVLLFPLSVRERAIVAVLNLLVGGTVLALEGHARAGRSRFLAVLRDWLPSILILVAYREAGLLVVPDPTHRWDHLFIRWDEALLGNPWVARALAAASPWLGPYLEFSYFLCYPVVPLGVATLYSRLRDVTPHVRLSQATLKDRAPELPDGSAVVHYWSAVLLAGLTCYVLFPFFPLTPPRELFPDFPGPQPASALRGLNHWLLDRYAVGACLFPSGHVAAVSAAALVIRRYAPRAGGVFLLVAVSIAAATVYGRYHYTADAVAGAAVGLASYFVSCRLPSPRGN